MEGILESTPPTTTWEHRCCDVVMHSPSGSDSFTLCLYGASEFDCGVSRIAAFLTEFVSVTSHTQLLANRRSSPSPDKSSTCTLPSCTCSTAHTANLNLNKHTQKMSFSGWPVLRLYGEYRSVAVSPRKRLSSKLPTGRCLQRLFRRRRICIALPLKPTSSIRNPETMSSPFFFNNYCRRSVTLCSAPPVLSRNSQWQLILRGITFRGPDCASVR